MKRWIIVLVIPCLMYGGEVVSVVGDVKAFVGQKWVALNKGSTLASGTKVMSGVKSEAQIKSPNGIITIKPMTLVTYEEKTTTEGTETTVGLKNGIVEVKYTKPPKGKAEFRVQTPKGTASVRGTEERVSYSVVEGMRLTVISGHVEVVGRQLLAGQELGVNPQGNVWDNTRRLSGMVHLGGDIQGEETVQNIRDIVSELLGEGLSLEDIANLLSDPQKL